MTMGTILRHIQPSVAAAWAVLVLAPAAAADPDYSPYVNCLSRGSVMGQGSIVFKNPDDAISLGRQIRQEYRTGKPGQVIYQELESQDGMTYWQAVTAVACSLMYNLPMS